MGADSVAVSTNVLSLCSGGGGLDLGFRLAVPNARTVCYVENEVTAAAVLAKNMAEGGLDDAPIWTDLRTFDGAAWRGVVDCIIGGYPCQPFSNAGKRLGTADHRHLWPAVADLVRSVQPEWCFFENVGAHLRLGFYEVARNLHEMGYTVAAGLFTASEVGAPHGRERLFILARRQAVANAGNVSGQVPQAGQPDGARGGAAASAGRERHIAPIGHAIESGLERRLIAVIEGADEWLAWPPGPTVANTERERGRSGHTEREHAAHAFTFRAGVGYGFPPGSTDSARWQEVIERRPDLAPAVEPSVRGMADGLAAGLGRSDKLHILGNGVVPQQAAYALSLLMEVQE